MSTQNKNPGPNSRPEITLIKKSGVNAVMSKRIFLDQEGHVSSDGSQCKMAEGTATRAVVETAGEFAKLIASCGSDQAFALDKLRDDVAVPAKITTVAKLKDSPGAIARTREYIDYRGGGPAWALIDFDTKGMPPEVAAGSKQKAACGTRFCRSRQVYNVRRACHAPARVLACIGKTRESQSAAEGVFTTTSS